MFVLPESKVKDVSSAMVVHHVLPPILIDGTVDTVTNFHTSLHTANMQDKAAPDLHISHLHLAVPHSQETLVVDLAALLGVEGSLVQDETTLHPRLARVNELFVVSYCQNHASATLKFILCILLSCLSFSDSATLRTSFGETPWNIIINVDRKDRNWEEEQVALYFDISAQTRKYQKIADVRS